MKIKTKKAWFRILLLDDETHMVYATTLREATIQALKKMTPEKQIEQVTIWRDQKQLELVDHPADFRIKEDICIYNEYIVKQEKIIKAREANRPSLDDLILGQ